MHCVHLGGFRREKLITNSATGKSYYELLDVLVKVSHASAAIS
jgi:hypothetical protein